MSDVSIKSIIYIFYSIFAPRPTQHFCISFQIFLDTGTGFLFD